MAVIKPCADLRNNYNQISKICHETQEPVYITKNGYNDLVILSNEAFEQYEDERINMLISKHLEQKFSDLESLKKDLEEKIDKALKEIEEGRYRPAEEVFKEMEAKYNLNEEI